MTGVLTGLAPPPAALSGPMTVSLHGPVDENMLSAWIDAVAAARRGQGPLVLELSTTGGDADIGRRMADDVRLFRDQTGRSAVFLGRTMIYSAGVTIMGGFLKADRWLGRDAALLIHGRKLTKCLELDGPLRSERPKVQALLAEVEEGLRVEAIEFGRLIEGSQVTLDELQQRIEGDWYLSADEAVRRGLVAGVA